jgi:hypothetical protein
MNSFPEGGPNMIRRREFAIAGLSGAALAAIQFPGLAEERKPGAPGGHADRFEVCAKACGDCQRECDACATHCAELMAKGDHHHLATLMSCRDCADFCSTAAQIVSRRGPFADLVCRACADACAHCAKDCERHGKDDKVMARCMEECQTCEKACREMVAHSETAQRR